MNKGVALIGGVGLGAALMYIFDPDRGKRRRALVQDKVTAVGHKAEISAEQVVATAESSLKPKPAAVNAPAARPKVDFAYLRQHVTMAATVSARNR